MSSDSEVCCPATHRPAPHLLALTVRLPQHKSQVALPHCCSPPAAPPRTRRWGVVADFLLLCDLFLASRTTYLDPRLGATITDPAYILGSYARGALLPNLIAVPALCAGAAP